jgi:sulfatase maturation enzyme AslB (radical SAM superfamily)
MLRKERDHFATVKVVSNKKRENIDPKLAKVLKTKGKRKLNVQVTEEDGVTEAKKMKSKVYNCFYMDSFKSWRRWPFKGISVTFLHKIDNCII